MKTIIAAICLMFISMTVNAETTYNSDGSTSQKYDNSFGSTTYNSDGSSSQTYDNSFGSTTYNSDGSSSQTYGNSKSK